LISHEVEKTSILYTGDVEFSGRTTLRMGE